MKKSGKNLRKLGKSQGISWDKKVETLNLIDHLDHNFLNAKS